MQRARFASILLKGTAVAATTALAVALGAAGRIAAFEPQARSLRRAAALRRVALGGPGTTPSERDGAAQALSDMFRKGIVAPSELDVYLGTVEATGYAAVLLEAARASREKRGGEHDDARSRAEDSLEAFACHLAARQTRKGWQRDVL